MYVRQQEREKLEALRKKAASDIEAQEKVIVSPPPPPLRFLPCVPPFFNLTQSSVSFQADLEKKHAEKK